jgi:hypothetical protein
VEDLIEIIVQTSLAVHAFYKYGSPLFGITDLQEIDLKIQKMMTKLQSAVSGQ